MNLSAARALAIRLMTDHGLIAQGWRFDFDNAQKRLGNCDYSRKRITISRLMTTAAETDDFVEQILLHEVAHALVGPSHGHGAVWKAKASSIGYRGKRTAVNPYQAQKRHELAVLSPLVEIPGAARRWVPAQELHVGEFILMHNNGLVARVEGFGRTRAAIMDSTGKQWRTTGGQRVEPTDEIREQFARLDRARRAAEVVVPTHFIRVGDRVSFVGIPSFAGKTGMVTKVNTQTYGVRVDGGEWRVGKSHVRLDDDQEFVLTSAAPLTVGDTVTVAHPRVAGRVGTIQKVNPKTYKVVIDGMTYNVTKSLVERAVAVGSAAA